MGGGHNILFRQVIVVEVKIGLVEFPGTGKRPLF